jgi:anti-sigma regulatory factor (Ser/Thr protein kinase)
MDDGVLQLFRRKKRPLSTSEVAESLRISRQAAHKKLRLLAAQGALATRGAGRSSQWVLATNERTARFATRGLAEDRVWATLSQDDPRIAVLGADARSIATYAFTEMLNNAIEHSGSKTIDVRVFGAPDGLGFEIVDRGVGAFESVRKGFALATPLEAVAELSKGKVTTMPASHSGEGLFFTSKAVRRFELDANGTRWVIDNERGDNTVTKGTARRGTTVTFVVPRTARRSLRSVFDEYTIEDAFARTRTVVRLFAVGTDFVSRSEARRMLAGLDRFREVIFDFADVASIGQGFADEVFRVWTQAHPDVVVRTQNANEEVQFMIARATPT